MRLPVIPFVVAAVLLSAVWYLFNAARSGERTIDVPRITRIADIDGIETEVAITPDGNRVADGEECCIGNAGELGGGRHRGGRAGGTRHCEDVRTARAVELRGALSM